MGWKISATQVLRGMACILTLAAAIVMGINHEKVNKSNTYIYEVKPTYWGAFHFFVVAYGMASGYNLFLTFLPRGSLLWRLAVAIDWIIMTLMIASFGMTLNTLIELKMGVVKAGWSPMCCFVPGFCTKVIIALSLALFALLICVPVFLYWVHLTANPFLLQETG